MNCGPTMKQAQVLCLISRSIRERGKAPTLQEIGDAMGGIRKPSVVCHLEALKRKGLVTLGHGTRRGIAITPTGAEFVQVWDAYRSEGEHNAN